MMNKLYLHFFINDDVNGFKYMFEHNIIKPIDVYNNKIMVMKFNSYIDSQLKPSNDTNTT